MVTLMSHGETGGGGASASATGSWFPAGAALGLAGLATASTAITCVAISQSSSSSAPPAAAVVLQQGNANDDSSGCYLLALSGLFYTGIAELGAAVWVMAEPRGRRVDAAGRKLVYASVVPLTAAVGLLAAAGTLFW